MRSRTCWLMPSVWPRRSATWAPPKPSRATPSPSPPDRRSPIGRGNRGYGPAARTTKPPRPRAAGAAAGDFVGTGDRGQARAAFTRAVEIYTSLGAAADVARVQARFRAHGIRRGPRAKHRQARSGWDSLTPTETKIAALVQGGLSNPEIAARLLLSRRTVATHVSPILRKLDVDSRTPI